MEDIRSSDVRSNSMLYKKSGDSNTLMLVGDAMVALQFGTQEKNLDELNIKFKEWKTNFVKISIHGDHWNPEKQVPVGGRELVYLAQ